MALNFENGNLIYTAHYPSSPTPKPLPEGCKPFDLAAALAGKPVITGAGKPVTNIKVFEGVMDGFSLAGVLNGTVVVRTIGGHTNKSGADWEQDRTFFMKVETKDVYFNIYNATRPEGHSHATEEAADKAFKDSGRKRVNEGGKALKVTVEI